MLNSDTTDMRSQRTLTTGSNNALIVGRVGVMLALPYDKIRQTIKEKNIYEFF